jgi:DNA-binding MarR family transcriptional regulator
VDDNYLSETLGGPSPHWRRQLPELFYGVVRRLRHHASEAAADFDLSFLQSRALRRLEQPMATGTLAEQLGLDRSNVTGVVDRLEERGLITRQPHPGDRRVKLVVLTDAGRATRAAIDERIFATVTLFEALSEEDQRDLAGLLSKLLERADAGASAPVVQ